MVDFVIAGGVGRGRPGGQGSQLAAELAQRMSDQARAGEALFPHRQQPGTAGQQGAARDPNQAHLFATIAAWLNRLNDAEGARSWPNIELPYPDTSTGEASPIPLLLPKWKRRSAQYQLRMVRIFGTRALAQVCDFLAEYMELSNACPRFTDCLSPSPVQWRADMVRRQL